MAHWAGMHTSTQNGRLAAGALCLGILAGSCGSPKGDDEVEATAKAQARPLDAEAALAASPQWLRFHAPDLSEGGYTLALFNRRVPFLMDMSGKVVHTWPRVRASARARLLPDGRVAVITDRGHLKEYDWEGNTTWSYRSGRGSHMFHHDFARLENGNYLLLVQWPSMRSDYLLEVDRDGQTVWRWNSHEALHEDFHRSVIDKNLTHTNSVQELPPNKWFDQGHEAFRPGNILLSARNLNTAYIVARPGGEVVWQYQGDLDWQHEARMIPPGSPGAGNILVFNNRYHSVERQSRIIEIDPVKQEVVWSYQSPGFFTGTGGIQQALPNGNLLVTSSRGGRVFEVTRDGEIAWQWTPAYMPMRALRYPYDYTPQLAALDRSPEQPIERENPEHYIDRAIYTFARTHDARLVPANGSRFNLLRKPSICQTLRLPEEMKLTVGYGIFRPGRCKSASERSVRYELSIHRPDAEVSETLLEHTTSMDSFEPTEGGQQLSLRRQTFTLDSQDRRPVEICLTLASASGRPPPRCFAWEAPRIEPVRSSETLVFDEEKSAEVLEHERRQLEALGYIN